MRECGWTRKPTGTAAFDRLSTSPCHGQAVGGAHAQPGKAVACAAAYKSPCWYGVSGCLPCDMAWIMGWTPMRATRPPGPWRVMPETLMVST
eukprot:9470925-Pyramimonas_sp.AAC.1